MRSVSKGTAGHTLTCPRQNARSLPYSPVNPQCFSSSNFAVKAMLLENETEPANKLITLLYASPAVMNVAETLTLFTKPTPNFVIEKVPSANGRALFSQREMNTRRNFVESCLKFLQKTPWHKRHYCWLPRRNDLQVDISGGVRMSTGVDNTVRLIESFRLKQWQRSCRTRRHAWEPFAHHWYNKNDGGM